MHEIREDGESGGMPLLLENHGERGRSGGSLPEFTKVNEAVLAPGGQLHCVEIVESSDEELSHRKVALIASRASAAYAGSDRCRRSFP